MRYTRKHKVYCITVASLKGLMPYSLPTTSFSNIQARFSRIIQLQKGKKPNRSGFTLLASVATSRGRNSQSRNKRKRSLQCYTIMYHSWAQWSKNSTFGPHLWIKKVSFLMLWDGKRCFLRLKESLASSLGRIWRRWLISCAIYVGIKQREVPTIARDLQKSKRTPSIARVSSWYPWVFS